MAPGVRGGGPAVPPAVRVRGVTVRYAPGVTALDAVTVEAARGEWLGLIGPNGAGKTTLLRVVAGGRPPDAGDVEVLGQPVASLPVRERARLVAVVPQVEGPPAGFTVEEAVAMGRHPHVSRMGRLAAADHAAVEGALHRAGIGALRRRLVETLSGGERQRVLIARALAQEAPVQLLDEPTAHLDLGVQLEIMDLLAELNRAGLTVIAAIHDLNLAAMYCARLALMDRGRILAEGSPETVLTAAEVARIYGAAVAVARHPLTGRPALTVLGRSDGPPPAGGANGRAGEPSGGMAAAARSQPVIAIDGPVGAGKSTAASEVARRLGYAYINTGSMYRAVAWEALRRQVALDDAPTLGEIAEALEIGFRDDETGQRVFVNHEDVTDALGAPEIAEAASRVSGQPSVRRALVARQRRMGEAGGVVMEGRDIGTVVFPDAEIKVFLTASAEERARRKFTEMRARGLAVDLDQVRGAEEARDRRDRDRAHSPLRPAADAAEIDTTGKSAAQVVEEILALALSRSRPRVV